MNIQKDPKTIGEQLYRFARANLVADGANFTEHIPLAEAGCRRRHSPAGTWRR